MAQKKERADDSPFEAWFSWWVPNKGYVWIDQANPAFNTEPKGQPPYLIKNPDGEIETKKFPLRDSPDLFSDFEALEPTREHVLEFANRYGWLWDRRPPVHRQGVGALSRRRSKSLAQ